MENMNQLKDLLKHEIQDLYSAEEQIIEALPAMIEKAKDSRLKKSLRDHLQVTELQKKRLDEVLLRLEGPEAETKNSNKKTGFFASLFGGSGKQVCKAMEGLITEGEKIMAEDMTADVMDAAIIAAAQKIEHYEIASYGTVRAYAEELNLDEVEKLLKQTLDEEYEADDLLTNLAVSRLNREAIGRSPRKKTAAKKSGNASPAKKKSAAKKAAPKKTKTAAKKSSSRNKGRSRSKAGAR